MMMMIIIIIIIIIIEAELITTRQLKTVCIHLLLCTTGIIPNQLHESLKLLILRPALQHILKYRKQ
jgi:hypothetical protein